MKDFWYGKAPVTESGELWSMEACDSVYHDAQYRAPTDLDVFVICPVREITADDRVKIDRIVTKAEIRGKTIYVPFRDTNQVRDPSGLRICADNKRAISVAKEIWVWYSPDSQGSLFDLGVAYAMGKPIRLMNSPNKTKGKSFANMLREWARL